ncbi:HAD family hydrolase [Bacillus tianshenii]|nr:HAD family hydrolase [Bacillus tianshenii]
MDWKCICFDLDNTLCDYEQAFEDGMIACFNEFAEKEWQCEKLPSPSEWFPVYKSLCDGYWHKVEDETFSKKEYQRRRLIDSLKKFDVHISIESADRFQAHFYELVVHYVTLYPGVDLLLSELRENEIKLGIISNGKKETQREKISRLGLQRWFSESDIFISDEVAAAKPEPSIFQYAERELKAQQDRKLYVGDSWDLDVLGALNAGWEALYVNTRKEMKPSSSLPLAVCETIKEAMNVILHRKW